MLSNMENSFDDTVLAVRRNRDDLTPLASKSMKLKVCTRKVEEMRIGIVY